MKLCKDCKEKKSISEFTVDSRGWVNLRCRICLNKHRKILRHRRGESKRYLEEIQKNRKYQGDHPEMIWRFGGNRKRILRRDKWVCQICRMTNKEHIKKYKKKLTIHHLDFKGRRYQDNGYKVNNNLENLQSLCLNCHGRIHGKQNKMKVGDATRNGVN